MNRLFLLFGFIFAACNLQSPDEQQASAHSYSAFASLFHTLDWESGDTLNLPSFKFGIPPSEAGYDSTQLLSSGMLQSLIPGNLLDNADYKEDIEAYPLAALNFGPAKIAYLVGMYQGFHAFHTQLFLYDSTQQNFSHTQSLDYLIGGGGFLSQRKAWMVDLNADALPDLVYRKDELYNSPEDAHSYFLDTLRAEVWDGFNFVSYPLDGQESLKVSFAMED